MTGGIVSRRDDRGLAAAPVDGLAGSPRPQLEITMSAHARAPGSDDVESSVNGLCRRLENQLVEVEVQPAAELEPGLSHPPAEFKAESLVQRDADRVLRIDAADHGVAPAVAAVDDRGQQELADATTATVLPT